MKTLKTFKEGLFQGGGTNVLCDVRTSCSISMQLLVEEQIVLGVKQRDTFVWNLCLTPKTICSSTSSCILVEQHVLTSHRTLVPPPWNNPSLKVFKVFIYTTQESKRISD